ncbi:DUF6665 family protein [Roseibium sp. HPY-6]|uniref:DUF6665 family protein n=1 Tax=Roseibium sp. HPY-6 TaxID=3229852 RepID=UPI00338F637D
MTVRPPQFTKPADKDPLAAALEQEIFNEKASTLSRLIKRLEKALELLKEAENDPDAPEELRLDRFAEAGEALWNVTIQRELCGLRRHREFNDHLGVPSAVRLSMGPASLTKKRSGR